MNLSEAQIKKLDIVLAVIAVIIIFFNILNRCSQDKEFILEEVKQEYISINDLISNDMSDMEQTRKLDNYVEKFLKRWEIKGGSLAIMKGGNLVYAKGYGWADEEAISWRSIPKNRSKCRSIWRRIC